MQLSRFFSIIITLILISNFSIAKAVDVKPQSSPALVKPASSPAVVAKPVASPVASQAAAQKPASDQCICAKPAADALNKAYTALEEDEWTSAETTTKNAITSIKSLSQTCKCPELVNYQKVAEAYLKYAQGGNHLDGADQPNCPFALKLYSDALSLFKEAIPGISNVEVKTNASNIQDYADEELQFVKDECEDTKPTPQPSAKKP